MSDFNDLGEETPKPKRKSSPRTPKKKLASISNLTKEVGVEIIRSVKLGSDLEMAAQFAGVTKYEVECWLDRAHKALEDEEVKEEDLKYVNFLKKLRRAVAQAQMIDLRRIDAAADSGKWQAAAWKLINGPSTRERWFQTRKHQHTGPDGGPIKHEVLSHSDVDLDRLMEALPLEVRILIVETLQRIKNGSNEDEEIKHLGEIIDHGEIKNPSLDGGNLDE